MGRSVPHTGNWMLWLDVHLLYGGLGTLTSICPNGFSFRSIEWGSSPGQACKTCAEFKDQYSSGLALDPGVHNLEGSTDRAFQQCDGYEAWGTKGFRAWIKTDSTRRWQRKGRNVHLAWWFLLIIGNLLLQTSIFIFSVYRSKCIYFPFTAVIMHFTDIFTCVYLFNVFSTK